MHVHFVKRYCTFSASTVTWLQRESLSRVYQGYHRAGGKHGEDYPSHRSSPSYDVWRYEPHCVSTAVECDSHTLCIRTHHNGLFIHS